MKKRSLGSVYFISKSLLWSVVLYTACMFIFNWDEMSASFKQYRAGNITQAQPLVKPDSIPQVSDNAKRSIISAVVRIGVEQVEKAVSSIAK